MCSCTLSGLRVTPQPEATRRTAMDTRTVKAAAAAPKRAHSQSANLGNSVKAGQDRDVQMNLVCSCAVHTRPLPYRHREHSERSPEGELHGVVTLGCGDACPSIQASGNLDWDLPDPAGRSLAEVRRNPDEIDCRVRALLHEIQPTDE